MTNYRELTRRLQAAHKSTVTHVEPKPVIEEIPFGVKDGKRFLTYTQLVHDPALMKFFKRFRACFREDWGNYIFWFEPEGKK